MVTWSAFAPAQMAGFAAGGKPMVGLGLAGLEATLTALFVGVDLGVDLVLEVVLLFFVEVVGVLFLVVLTGTGALQRFALARRSTVPPG